MIDGLRQFFQLCRIADGTLVGIPSKAVDEAWHCVILFTRDYARLCGGAFRTFLHHTPETGIAGPDMQVANTRTWALAYQIEGVDPREPDRVPLLFRVDSELGLPNSCAFDGIASCVEADLPALAARLDGRRPARGLSTASCAAVVGNPGGSSCGASSSGGSSCGGGG